MKKDELRDALVKMGIPSMFYNLDGNGRTDERLCCARVNSTASYKVL